MPATSNPQKTFVFIYNINHDLVKKISIDKAVELLKTKASCIIDAATSFKGYGFVKTHFVSLKEIDTFKTTEEVIKIFNNWLKINLVKNIAKLKNMYSKYNEEYLYKSLSYITEAINTPRSINSFEPALIFKYKAEMVDEKRRNLLKKDRGEVTDFDVTNDGIDADYKAQIEFSNIVMPYSQNSHAYINTFASEDDYIWTSKMYNCIDDYNSMKQVDTIGFILKEKYNVKTVDLFVEVLQSDNYDFKSITEIPKFKFATIVRRHKTVIEDIRKLLPNSKESNTIFITALIHECWEELVNSLHRIKQESLQHTYKNLDDYTIKELI